MQELWEKTWSNYQEGLENTVERQLRSSKYNEEDPDWYANVSPRQFHRLKEFFMPVWKKIAWNPMVATSTLEEILQKDKSQRSRERTNKTKDYGTRSGRRRIRLRRIKTPSDR